MAIVKMFGLETGNVLKSAGGLFDYQSGGTVTTGAEAAGFSGTYYLAGDATVGWDVTARDDYYTMMRCKNSGGDTAIIYWYYGSTVLGNLAWEYVTQKLKLYKGSSTLIGTGTTIVGSGTVHRIEVYWKRNTYTGGNPNSDGQCIVKIDGIIESTLNLNNIQTAIQDSQINHFRYKCRTGAMDDWMCDNADWLGNQHIQLIEPTAAGGSTQYTPSTGSNYDCVNEVPASTTDYIATNTDTHKDLYTMDNLTESAENPITAVSAVQHIAFVKQVGTSAVPYLKFVSELSATEEESASYAIPEDVETTLSHIFATKPGGGAWTKSDVDSMTAGPEANAS